MFLSRILVLAFLGLTARSAAQAADTHAFSVLVHNSDGQPILFQSTSALKKGDVINVASFNAPPILLLQIAMCDLDCSHMHLVKTMVLTPYFLAQGNMNQNFVVPENGHVSFWVQWAPLLYPFLATTTWSGELVDPFLNYSTPQLFPETGPVPVKALHLDDSQLQARFNHRTFVTVRLADAGN
jgi:hypothetical protein